LTETRPSRYFAVKIRNFSRKILLILLFLAEIYSQIDRWTRPTGKSDQVFGFFYETTVWEVEL